MSLHCPFPRGIIAGHGRIVRAMGDNPPRGSSQFQFLLFALCLVVQSQVNLSL
jgi:hypothetical protein